MGILTAMEEEGIFFAIWTRMRKFSVSVTQATRRTPKLLLQSLFREKRQTRVVKIFLRILQHFSQHFPPKINLQLVHLKKWNSQILKEMFSKEFLEIQFLMFMHLLSKEVNGRRPSSHKMVYRISLKNLNLKIF